MRKKTGDLEVFKEIWEERPHESEISGEVLYEFSVMYFAHVLGKGAYPSLRHDKGNIVLMTPGEHFMFDHETHRAKEDKRFNWVFDKKIELTRKYYDQQL